MRYECIEHMHPEKHSEPCWATCILLTLAIGRNIFLRNTLTCCVTHANHMLQRAWLQREWNILVTTSRQDKTRHVAKCHNFWNHFSMTMQELQVCFGLFNAKGVFHLHLFQSQLTFFGPYMILYDIWPYSSFSELFTVILVGVCAQHRALVGAQHCPTLTWYEKVWASCTLILCKKGALDCLPCGTATVGVGCSKGSNTDCLQASSNIFKPAS